MLAVYGQSWMDEEPVGSLECGELVETSRRGSISAWDRTLSSFTSKVSEETWEDREDLQQVDGRDLFAILLQPMAWEEP